MKAIVVILLVVALLFIGRFVMLWYFKIAEIVRLLSEIERHLNDE
jgi:hypothetical protein